MRTSARTSGRAPLIVGALALTLAGQVLLQVAGRLLPGAVRFPGPWVPTPTPDTSVLFAIASGLPDLKAENVTKVAYVIVLRLDAAIGLGGWGAIILQLLVLGLAAATMATYVGARYGHRAGLLAAAALTLNPQVAQWVKTMLTDSLFISLMVLLVLSLARSIDREAPLGPVLLLASVAVLLRPNGLGAAVGVLFVIIASMRRRRVAAALLAMASIIAVVLFSPVFVTPGGDENTLAARTYDGLVVWADPYDVSTTMPRPVDPDDLSNTALLRYAVTNPLPVLGLGLRRVGWELIQVRGHYPRSANVVTALLVAGVVLLTLLGRREARGSSINRAIAAVSVGLALVIAATWAIAEGRFGWAVMATWSPLVGIGLDRLLDGPRGRSGASRGRAEVV